MFRTLNSYLVENKTLLSYPEPNRRDVNTYWRILGMTRLDFNVITG